MDEQTKQLKTIGYSDEEIAKMDDMEKEYAIQEWRRNIYENGDEIEKKAVSLGFSYTTSADEKLPGYWNQVTGWIWENNKESQFTEEELREITRRAKYERELDDIAAWES